MTQTYAYSFLNVSVDTRGAASVALARPPVNAFEPALIKELNTCFSRMGGDDNIRTVVLCGEGKVFSAGADLNWMRAMAGYTHEENVDDAMNLARMLEAMYQCGKPLVGKIHGAAMGGGVGLAAVCDWAVAAEHTKFAFSEVRLGLRPSTISSYCIPKLGAQNARILFQTGQDFFADEAKRCGLIDAVAPADGLDHAVSEAVEFALKEGKQALRQRSQEGRAARETIAPSGAVPGNERMEALIEGVSARLKDTSEGARQRLMNFTAADIAAARDSDTAREKISAVLAKAAQQKAS